MVDASQAPATKQDVQMLMEEQTKLHIAIADLEVRLEEKLDTKMDQKMEKWAQFLMRSIEVLFENFSHNYISAKKDLVELLKDKLENHNRRIEVLERRAGLIFG
jgi:predicted RNase H-like nuclease (RuvC/YqgF family)